MNSKSRMLSWCFVGIVGLTLGAYLLMAASGRTPGENDYDLETVGRLPIVDHGRVKPLDTLARINLMILSGKQEYKDEKGNTQPAIRWLLDVMTAAYQAGSDDPLMIAGESRNVKAYRVEDPALRARLRLEGGPVYSYQEILDAAGVERVVYCSSVAALGLRGDGAPGDETTSVDPAAIVGVYKRSKYAAEREVRRGS